MEEQQQSRGAPQQTVVTSVPAGVRRSSKTTVVDELDGHRGPFRRAQIGRRMDPSNSGTER
jgi:hypothetical protein